MGIIRGKHTSPGVYTKITSIRKPRKDVVTSPMSTKNVVISGNAQPQPTYFVYYGYYPIRYLNKKPRNEDLSRLSTILAPQIFEKGTFTNFTIDKTKIEIDGVTIPEEVSENDVKSWVANGGSIEDLPNYCQMLLVPSKYYSTMKIFDGTFSDIDITNIFTIHQNKLWYNNMYYTLLCVFDGHFVFAPLGMDAYIAPIKLQF